MKSGWQTKTLEEACLFLNGLWKGEVAPLINVGVIRNTNFTKDGKLDDSEIAYLDVEVKKFDKRKLRFGDIILEKSGGGPKQPVGRVALFEKTEGNFSFSNFTSAIRVRNVDELDYRFLHLFLYWIYLSGVTEGMQSHSTGIRNLDGNAYKAIPIHFPAVKEQVRIVSLIEDSFDAISRAILNIEKSLANSKEVFESVLRSIFIEKSDKWLSEKLVGLTTKIGSGATPLGGEASYKESGISLIRSLNVHDRNFRYEKLAFIDDSQADRLSNVIVQPNDVLLNITGASVARCCMVPDGVLPARVNQHVSIIRPVADKLNSEFLQYLLTSQPYKDKLLQTGEDGGATRQAITKAQLQEFVISYPDSLEEQISIVSNLNELSVETKRLGDIYQQKLDALDELKKSILQQAFTGQLS